MVAKHSIDGGPADAKGSCNRAHRFTARVHTLCQTGFLRIERLGTPDVLAAYPTCLTRRCSTLTDMPRDTQRSPPLKTWRNVL